MTAAPKNRPAVLGCDTNTPASTGDTGIAKRALSAHLDGIVYRARSDIDWTFEYLGGGCRALTGFSPEDLLDNPLLSFASLIYPDDSPIVRQRRAEALEQNHSYEIEYRIYDADGLLRWLSDRGARLPGRQVDGATRIEGVILDITARKLADLAARESERRYRGLFDNAIEGIFRTTPEGRYLEANPALARIYGFESIDELIRSLDNIGRQLYVDPSRREEFMRLVRVRESVTGFESQVYRRDGAIIWISENARAVNDANGNLLYYEGTAEDVTERKLYEVRLERQANYDSLTGLANRALFSDRLERAILTADRSGAAPAVVFFDLDRFKFINDTLGHSVGDALLRTVADRLGGCVRECDTVARLGGDEFVVLVNGHGGADTIKTLVDRLIAAVIAPWTIEHGTFNVTCSVGIALYPNDGISAEILLKHADSAMYRAKELGRNSCQFFTTELNEFLTEKQTLQRGLSRALEQQQLQLYYQPRVDLTNARIVGVEALLRWNLPGHGLLDPGRFIPIAEDTGLILPIGRWVLEQACRQNLAWQRQGLPPIPISVNVSAVQFQQQDFVHTVTSILENTELPAKHLELEVTESLLMQDASQLVDRVLQLKAFGISISIDDFGTGYSSLAYLKRFAVDRLKVDRSFIGDLREGTDDAAIARTIIVLGHTLGLRIVAEGVETAGQAVFLRDNGCDEAQGYLFSRPVNASEFEALLRKPTLLFE
ncbi:MAG TPA: EAL domain-containing protein [Steroidobacteraceae bacterium]|jgi:diguanylate cyclase (GGDEF)-like protein/PAS domain S-box-containing protein|nr:EAL domain-containing protein [Steroidobacteraceae bacterium]